MYRAEIRAADVNSDEAEEAAAGAQLFLLCRGERCAASSLPILGDDGGLGDGTLLRGIES
jgi:hypothetical protein